MKIYEDGAMKVFSERKVNLGKGTHGLIDQIGKDRFRMSMYDKGGSGSTTVEFVGKMFLDVLELFKK